MSAKRQSAKRKTMDDTAPLERSNALRAALPWSCLRCNVRTDRSPDDRLLCVACVDALAAASRKRCRGCNRFVALRLFGKDRHARDGLTTRCRGCRYRTNSAWKRQHRERVRAADQALRRQHPDRYRGYAQTQREQNGERRRQTGRESYARHRDKRNAHDRERYEQNRTQRQAWQRDYHERNKERILARRRERYQERKLAVLREIQQRTEP